MSKQGGTHDRLHPLMIENAMNAQHVSSVSLRKSFDRSWYTTTLVPAAILSTVGQAERDLSMCASWIQRRYSEC